MSVRACMLMSVCVRALASSVRACLRVIVCDCINAVCSGDVSSSGFGAVSAIGTSSSSVV